MILVVGAGAAGLMAAIAAGGRGAPVVVLEGTAEGGRKILISGGGRCNVLPAALEPERFVSDSPPVLVRRLLRSWPLEAQRTFFEREVGVPLRFEAETRKWFPASNRSRDVRDALVARATHLGVAFRFGTTLLDLRPSPSGWQAETTQGPIGAARVVLATGGLSVPSTGSAGAGLRIAAALGHVVHETYPALTPLLAAPHPHAHLSGVSVSARVRAESPRDRADATGGLLITHRGYSGPAVLDVSHVATRSAAAGGRAVVRVRWSDLGAAEWQEACAAGGTALVATVVARHLPRRLADALVIEAGIDPGCRLADLRRDARARLIERLVSSELPWTGDEGYRKAEVTGGGVALDEVEPRTLESRRHPGLFLCGELLDAFGPIGGHNFAWAWATGRAAGLAAAAA